MHVDSPTATSPTPPCQPHQPPSPTAGWWAHPASGRVAPPRTGSRQIPPSLQAQPPGTDRLQAEKQLPLGARNSFRAVTARSHLYELVSPYHVSTVTIRADLSAQKRYQRQDLNQGKTALSGHTWKWQGKMQCKDHEMKSPPWILPTATARGREAPQEPHPSKPQPREPRISTLQGDLLREQAGCVGLELQAAPHPHSLSATEGPACVLVFFETSLVYGVVLNLAR